MNDTKTTPRPVLVIVRGLPGGGKSYVAHAVQQKLGADSVMLIDPDAVNQEDAAYIDFTAELRAQGVDEKLYPYRYLRSQAYAAITEGKVVVWNQAFTHADLLDRTIKNLQAHAEEHGLALPALVVEVQVDPALAKKRVAERAANGGHDVTEAVFERFINDYATFADYGYPTIQVDGNGDVAVTSAAIVEALNKLQAN